MKRYYFISNNLDDLESIENELEQRGITTLQIHVLSQRDADVENHKLHEVSSFMKQDVVHSSLFGAFVGLVICALFLAGVHFSGIALSAPGWIPFLFLAVVLLGFCVWEGGLRGIQEPNHRFLRFQEILRSGKHVFFVDVDNREKTVLDKVMSMHSELQPAGVERVGAHWMITWRQRVLDFVHTLP